MMSRNNRHDDALWALGRAVRALRTEKAMMQEDLAMAAGVHPTYISYIESGRRNLTVTALMKISSALDVTAAELLERAAEIEQKEAET